MNTQHIPQCPLSPKQLDTQCHLHMEEWLDIDSPKAKEMDTYYFVTKKWLAIGVEAGMMFLDAQGRVWGNGGAGWFPYHFEANGKLYGYKVCTRAAN